MIGNYYEIFQTVCQTVKENRRAESIVASSFARTMPQLTLAKLPRMLRVRTINSFIRPYNHRAHLFKNYEIPPGRKFCGDDELILAVEEWCLQSEL